VTVPKEFLIAGPVEDVMKTGQGGGAGSLTTSSLAIGLAASALNRFESETEKRPDLVESYEPLRNEWRNLHADLIRALSPDENADEKLSAETIRRRANSLSLRSTQAYLAATKGAGFLASHPASRLVREAMFFLVWSCPQPLMHAALREFACLVD
jgi:hypothetical protein